MATPLPPSGSAHRGIACSSPQSTSLPLEYLPCRSSSEESLLISAASPSHRCRLPIGLAPALPPSLGSYYFLGAASLLAWNGLVLLLSCGTYYDILLDSRPHYASAFVSSYTLSGMAGLLSSIWLSSRRPSTRVRDAATHASLLIACSSYMVQIWVAMGMAGDPSRLFAATVACCGSLGFSSAVFQSVLMGTASSARKGATGAVITAQALGGIATAMVGMFQSYYDQIGGNEGEAGGDSGGSHAYATDTIALTTFVTLAFVMGVLCPVIYARLAKKEDESRIAEEVPISLPPPADEEDSSAEECYRLTKNDRADTITTLGTSDEYETPDQSPHLVTVWEVVLAAAPYELSVFLVFVVTLAVFPALVTNIAGNGPPTGPLGPALFPPLLVLIYNVSDMAGRAASAACDPDATVTGRPPVCGAVARAALIPALLLCQVYGSRLPVVFSNAAWPAVFVVTLGVSNGYVSCVAMSEAPTAAPGGAQGRHLCGQAMTVFLGAGLIAGSLLSFPVMAVSRRGL